MNPSSSTPDHASPAFQDYAEAQATATVRALIARAAKPALTELEALRVALDVRCESLTATLGGASTVDPSPIHELVQRLTHAAGEEASAAARAARSLALEEAEARLQQDRAEAQRLLDALRAEAAEERTANHSERAALTDALAKATLQAEALRAERDAQIDALRVAQEQADTVRADRDAQLDALRTAQAHAESLRADRDAQLDAHQAAQAQADALRADRDAHLEALRSAQAHAESLRTDRDAQLDALRVAAEQIAAVGAERDAHRQAAESARAEASTVQSEQDALLEAARISNARHTRLLEQAQARAEAAQAEADAARAQAVAAREQAAAAEAQLATAHARTADAEAKLAAAQAEIETVQAQLAAAQAESERLLAIGAAEIEALRAELERVRERMQTANHAAGDAVAAVAARPELSEPVALAVEPPAVALFEVAHQFIVEPTAHVHEAVAVADTMVPSHADVAPVEPAQAFDAAPLVEFEAPAAVVEPFAPVAVEPVEQMPAALAVVEPAPVVEETMAVADHQLPVRATPIVEPFLEPVHAVAETSVEPVHTAAESLIDAIPMAQVPDPADTDPVLAMYQAITGAADLSQVLDALIDGVGSLFPRAALFVVKTKSKRLQGWRSVGFTGVAAITREFEFPLSTDSALTRAVTASRTIFTGEGQPTAQPNEAWTVTFPVTTGGRVVAVVHADSGGRSSEPAAAFDRETALDLGHTLVRMAGERIGALTMSARAAFGNVMNVAPPAVAAVAQPVPVAVAPLNGTHQASAPINGTHAGSAPINGTRNNVAHINGAGLNGARQSAAPAPAAEDEAGRFASQLVSEINRYNVVAAADAPAEPNLQERLAGQIEGARPPAPAAPASPAASALGMFDEALGKMLGSAEPAPAIQPV